MSGTINKRQVLVIAPHADDAEFGIGGLLYKLTSWISETDVRVVVMAKGGYRRSSGQYVDYDGRKNEAREALAILGVHDVVFAAAFDENRALEEPYSQIVNAIELEIEKFDPTSLFVCLPSFNQDHQRVFDAFVTATRPGALAPSVQHVCAYEYPGNSWGPAGPKWGRVYVRLNESVMKSKLEALARHKSQFAGREGEHVTPDGARKLAALRGSECGSPYAELVYLMRGMI